MAPAWASLQSLTVSSQSGALTAGTPGVASYTVTVTRSVGSPAAATLSVTGLPTGATAVFGTPSDWSAATGTGSQTIVLTVSTSAAMPAGATTFTARAAAAFNITRTGNGTLTIAAAPVQPASIAFAPAPAPTYLGGNFAVSASTNSNGALTYSVASGPCALVNGATFSTTGAGSCRIQANTAATSAYLAGTASQDVAVGKANQGISFNPLAPHYVGDAPFAVSAAATSTLPVSFAAVGDCSVTGHTVSVATPATLPGTCTLTASQAGNSNFNAASAVAQTFAINAFTGSELYAVSGMAALPGQNLAVLGYNTTGNAVTQAGGAPITVTQGSTVSIRLHNSLAVPTSLLFQGQSMVPDTTGVAPGETKVYSFTASQPGTYLYEAGLLSGAQYQAAMGLHGALVVRPTASAKQAYADAATAFDKEAVLVLSEIDPALNSAADPAAFDMRSFAPRYFLINGAVYPSTDSIAVAPGDKLLLRYVNAGMQHHSMAVLGLRQNFVAKDAGLLPTLTRNVAAETLAPGQTGDALVMLPASAADGSKFALYEGNLKLYNNGDGSRFGGMLTFVAVAGSAGTGDSTGPLTSGASVGLFGTLSATVSDAGRGDSAVTAAEYFLDATTANGSGLPMAALDAAAVTRSFASTAPLTGSHTVFVHGRDSANNWGPFTTTTLVADTVGPTTSALVLLPNPSNGLVDVALSATANDTASGGSAITAAEYQIDGAAPVPMAVSPAGARIASVSATIAAASVNALANGNHTVSVRSRDALGNWGNPVTTTLTVNTSSGPVTSAVSVTPNPNNGAIPLSSTQPVVRVTATISCTATCMNVGAAEGFIDNPAGANGSGFPFVPADGAWNGQTEAVYADIPLSTIAALSSGNHTLSVHGKEAVGVWGAASSTTLTIDKAAPSIASVTLSPSTLAFGTASTTLAVSAADVGTGVVGGQYWIDGSATPPANATAFTGVAPSIATSELAAGTRTVWVRVRDAASNWSAVTSTTLYVVRAVNDSVTLTSTTATGVQTNTRSAPGVLGNDQPTGVAGRTAALLSGPVRTSNGSGNGTGTLNVTCGNTAATAICADGSYVIRLTPTGTSNATRQSSKRGTYSFTYKQTLNGVTSNATVTLTVN
jgi:hypothetical protein